MSLVLVLLLTGLAAVILAVTPPIAQAFCTASWDGGGGDGEWGTSSNWSPDTLPTEADEVCLPATTSVTITTEARVGSLQAGQARVTVSANGVLELTDTDRASAVDALTLSGNGQLSGAATLNVASALSWSGGRMIGAGDPGPGATILGAGATATINPGNGNRVWLNQRALINHGTMTITSGALAASRGAIIENHGLSMQTHSPLALH